VVEVPIIKEVYINKEVPIEVFKDRIEYVDRPVYIEVPKEVFKDRVEYIDRPVYIEIPVDRKVEVIERDTRDER
jgi:hypothetical protein